MNQNFEQDIPLVPIIIGFIIFFVLSQVLRKWLRKRFLIKQGQLDSVGTKIPTIEERVAANKEWASGEIRSNGGSFMIVMWILAIVWNLTFGVSFFKSLSNPEFSLGPRIILGLFAAGGIPAIYFAIRATMRHFRFGHSLCVIQGKAGVIGKGISGRIKTIHEIPATGDYSILLQCIETYYVGSGKNRTSKTNIIWQGKQTVPPAGQSSRAGIPFSFEIPKYPPETGDQVSLGRLNWQVQIDAPVEGVDFNAIFIVPVFKIT